MQLTVGGTGTTIATRAYRLTVPDDRPWAILGDGTGGEWAKLALAASVDTTEGPDVAVRLEAPVVEEQRPDRVVIRLDAVSDRWTNRAIRLTCEEEVVRFSVSVAGTGTLTECHLLGGWSTANPRLGTGFARSTRAFGRLLNPSPSDPHRIDQPASEAAVVGILGGGQPGRGHWFFTPAPFCVPVTRSEPADWLGIELAVGVDDATFTEWRYEPVDDGWSLRLAYEGQTAVDGRWESPAVVLRPGAVDPYRAIAAHADALRADGLAPPAPTAQPDWWYEPMFCGWGEQSHLARTQTTLTAAFANQACYDEFLGTLDANGIEPGTIVIDDRWQATYGRNEPDDAKWPNLPAWIAARHARGQRVLLWWKAWDPDGVDASLCIRTQDGRPVTVDPTHPEYATLVASRIAALLGPNGLDADGFKVDFTALGPSGPGLRRHGAGWGVALLHRLLELIHDAAKAAKPDALVITHAPNPAFVDVSDMLRLNDLLRLADPAAATVRAVPQYTHRARIVAAACPGTPIDTDDWCLPNRAEWRAWLDAKTTLGVPALYHSSHIDFTGEPLEAADYAAIRERWAAYRAGRYPRRQ
ncbi:MAG: hypothetical protein ACJ761_06830 [Chloroflexota bacterium]